jgi:hypothetical protein
VEAVKYEIYQSSEHGTVVEKTIWWTPERCTTYVRRADGTSYAIEHEDGSTDSDRPIEDIDAPYAPSFAGILAEARAAG